MKPTVSSRPDGLGTRLLTLLYALRFSERFKGSLAIDWPSLTDSNYISDTPLLQRESASELFDIDYPIKGRNDISFVNSLPGQALRCCKMSGAINDFNIRVEREIEEVIDSFDYVLYDIPEPVLFAKTDGNAEKAIAKYNWQRLNFSPLITDSFQAFSSLSNLEECVAVHVRRGDLLNKLRHESVEDLLRSGATEIFQRYIPMKTICDILLHKFPGLKTCIICSESRDIANQLGRLQPEINFIHSASAYSQNCNQRALLDLLILANAAYTVAPFKSYFSSCAEAVGRCKLINSSLDIPNLVEELTQALDNLDSPDLKTRRAIVYAYGYLNLWYEPQSQLRHKLKEMTFSEDSDIGKLLLDQDE